MMLLGSGEFGREWAAAFHRLGADEVAPARRIPDREGLRRLAANELGLPTVPFWFARSPEELRAVADHAGFPLVVKPLRELPEGGQSVLLRVEDIAPAWQRATAGPQDHVLVESVVEIDYEVTVLAVRTDDGEPIRFCAPIGHRHVDGVLQASQPQPMTDVARDAAHSVAARVVNALGGRGVFGVELRVCGDEVYFSDLASDGAPELPDAALVTLRSQRLTVFDLYARALLGLPVDTLMVSPTAMELRYAPARRPVVDQVRAALRVPETDVWVPAGPAPHRVSLTFATAPDLAQARERARQAGHALT